MLDTTAALAGAAAILATVYLALSLHLRVTQDVREPVVVETRLPYITPLLNLGSVRYFGWIRAKYPNLPLYTLRLPGTRLYVLNSTKLIASTQRHPKTYTFQAIQDKFAHLVCNLSPTAVQAQKREFDAWIRDTANVASPSHVTFEGLLPGKSLDGMNRVVVAALGKEWDAWAGDGGGVERDLFEWVKDVVTVAVTEGVYGEENPYRDESTRRHFWNYNAGVGTLSMGSLIANLFARSSLQSRAHLASLFTQYYTQNHHTHASDLTLQRFTWHQTRGFPLADTANMEVGHGIAILSNTIPTAFWLLIRIFSSPTLLSTIRTELLPLISETPSTAPGNPIQKTLNIAALTTSPKSCPTLHSTLKETLRVHGKGVGVRGVLHDHLLDGQHLLRKDSILLIPSTIQHSDPHIWGADAHEFRHDRFMAGSEGGERSQRVNGTAFRAFGGGATLCPGRHFAVTAVLAFAAMVVVRFDVQPACVEGRRDDEREWVVPTAEKADLTKVMPSPDFDVRVLMKRREKDGEEGVRWTCEFKGGSGSEVVEDHDLGEK